MTLDEPVTVMLPVRRPGYAMSTASFAPAVKSRKGTASTGTSDEATRNSDESRPRPKKRSPMPTVCAGFRDVPKSTRPPACIGRPVRPPPNKICASGKIPAVVEDSVAGSVVTSGGKSRPCRHHSNVSSRNQTSVLQHIGPQSQPPPAPPQAPQGPHPPQAEQPPPKLVPESGPPPAKLQVPY